MPGLSIDAKDRLMVVISCSDWRTIRQLAQAGWRRVEEDGIKGVCMVKHPWTREDIQYILQIIPDVRVWHNVRRWLRGDTT